MQQQAAAAAAAAVYGLPSLAQPGMKRPMPSMTPTDFANATATLIKRPNLLESAAHQAAQQAQAAFQQRAHLLQAAGTSFQGLPTLNSNSGGIGMHGINSLNNAMAQNAMNQNAMNQMNSMSQMNSMNQMNQMNSMNGLMGGKSTSNDSDPGRMPHRLIEKKRRDRINSCINTLRELLPENIKKATNRPLEKAIVLELAIDYIKQLQDGKDPSPAASSTPQNTEAIQTISKSTLASTYEKGWIDASSQVTQMLKSGQPVNEISMRPTRDSPFLARFINENASKMLQSMMTAENKDAKSASKRVPSTGSEGYDSDETGRKGSVSKDCDAGGVEVKKEAVETKTEKTVENVQVQNKVQNVQVKLSQNTAQTQVQSQVQTQIQSQVQNMAQIQQNQKLAQIQAQNQAFNRAQQIQARTAQNQLRAQHQLQNRVQAPLHNLVQNQSSQLQNQSQTQHQQTVQTSVLMQNCQRGSCGGSDKITESSDENSEIDVC